LVLFLLLEVVGLLGRGRTSWRKSRRINKAVYCKKKFSLYEPYM